MMVGRQWAHVSTIGTTICSHPLHEPAAGPACNGFGLLRSRMASFKVLLFCSNTALSNSWSPTMIAPPSFWESIRLISLILFRASKAPAWYFPAPTPVMNSARRRHLSRNQSAWPSHSVRGQSKDLVHSLFCQCSHASKRRPGPVSLSSCGVGKMRHWGSGTEAMWCSKSGTGQCQEPGVILTHPLPDAYQPCC